MSFLFRRINPFASSPTPVPSSFPNTSTTSESTATSTIDGSNVSTTEKNQVDKENQTMPACPPPSPTLARRHLSASRELSLSDNPSPLIPERFARVVSTLSRGSTVTLRLGTYVVASLLDSARIGTLTSLSVTCGAIENIMLKAEHDTSINRSNNLTPVNQLPHPSTSSSSSVLANETSGTMTVSGMNTINRIATLAQLFTAASFHLASSSLQTASGVAQDTLHILDAVFGSTESSRALAAIITLIRREFGDGSGIYSLVTGLTCFTILQSRGWSRTVDEIEMFIVWDVVVLDTGETLSQQFPSTTEPQKETEEDTIISIIPHNSQYKIAINEVKTKTYNVDVSTDTPIPDIQLPKGATILHKEFVPAKNEGEKSKYTITFQTTSKYFRERKGTLSKDNNPDQQHQVSLAEFIPDPTAVSIQTRPASPSLPDNYDDEPPTCINDRRYSFNNPLVLETLLSGETSNGNSDISDDPNNSYLSDSCNDSEDTDADSNDSLLFNGSININNMSNNKKNGNINTIINNDNTTTTTTTTNTTNNIISNNEGNDLYDSSISSPIIATLSHTHSDSSLSSITGNLDKPTKHSQRLIESDYNSMSVKSLSSLLTSNIGSNIDTTKSNGNNINKANENGTINGNGYNNIDNSEHQSLFQSSSTINPGNINRRSLTHLSSLARSTSQTSMGVQQPLCMISPDVSRPPSHSNSSCNLINEGQVPKTTNGIRKNYSISSFTSKTSKNNSNSNGNSNGNGNGNLNTTDNTKNYSKTNGGGVSGGGGSSSIKSMTESTTTALSSKSSNSRKFPPGHITQNMARYMRFATASYGQSFMYVLGMGKFATNYTSDPSHHSEHYAFANHTRLDLEDIVLSSYSDSAVDDKAGIPLVHFVALDHAAKAVVLTIRGTLGIEDILTDLTCDYETLDWQSETWKAHGGMLRCAEMIKRRTSRVFTTIKQALETWGDDYGLVICGHSLGGGVGAILGILLTEMNAEGNFVTSQASLLPPGRPVHCFAFGPPASISEELRKETTGLITTVVYGLDIVPCLSLGVLRDFQSVAMAFKNDREGVANDIRKRFIAQFASRHSPLSVHDADDDYLWVLLKRLRKVMQSEKLVPPGEVYHISTNTVFEMHDGKTKRATRIIGKVIVDVQKRFGEPVFGRGIFHHSPVYYERALRTLEMGVCNAPV